MATPGAISQSHAYAAAGIYTITVTVTDKNGGIGSNTTTSFVVVYDPNGGFVTGGGWINSPVGAYVADGSLAGKATFGFVSKYKKGQSVPDGNTEFQFHAAGMNFASTAYEWLVLAGARAQYKGTGTINGAGNYGFMLTAIDGSVNGGGGTDRFRIKIWDNNNGGAIVYDNQISTTDDAGLTTVGTLLGGGSIQIHN
jgi:PKD repeat protein